METHDGEPAFPVVRALGFTTAYTLAQLFRQGHLLPDEIEVHLQAFCAGLCASTRVFIRELDADDAP